MVPESELSFLPAPAPLMIGIIGASVGCVAVREHFQIIAIVYMLAYVLILWHMIHIAILNMVLLAMK